MNRITKIDIETKDGKILVLCLEEKNSYFIAPDGFYKTTTLRMIDKLCGFRNTMSASMLNVIKATTCPMFKSFKITFKDGGQIGFDDNGFYKTTDDVPNVELITSRRFPMIHQSSDKIVEKLNEMFPGTDDFYRKSPFRKVFYATKVNSMGKQMITTKFGDINGPIDFAPNGLSTGERNLFIVLYTLICDHGKENIILFDELDYMHLACQQTIGRYIYKNRTNQIIMATHSPFVTAGCPESIVEFNFKNHDDFFKEDKKK